MSNGRSLARLRFLIRPRWLAWHAFAVFAAWGMLWLGDWQFHRAESGNALSWAYTFEWPIFVVFGVVFWAKTVVDAYKEQGRAAQPVAPEADEAGPGIDLPAAAHTAADLDEATDDDPELAAYNAYLAKLNRRSG